MGHRTGGEPELFPEGDEERLTLPASLIAVFGLERVVGAGSTASGLTDEYSARAYQVNMPAQLTERDETRGWNLDIKPEARAQIAERAKSLVAIPRTQDHPFKDDELRAFVAYLDGMAEGKSIAEIARGIPMPDRTLKRRAVLMRDYLGATNEASIVYGALLHGYTPQLSLPREWRRPELTPNEALHLYLAGIGFQKPEVSDLIGVRPGTVRQHRLRGLAKYGAHSTTQALARGFHAGDLITVTAYERRAHA
jgi:DNA-binding CsgD family transcriptional regulator